MLVISLAVYFIFSVLTVVIPYKPDRQKISIRPQRIVKLTEIPLKGHVPAAIPAKLREKQRLLEEQKRREEERKKAETAKKAEDEKKKLEEAKRLAEDRKKQEEERIKADERKRAEEEKRRAEEEQRLAKERNKEIAKNSGLLKAMQGRGKSADSLVNTEEIGNVIAQSQVKSVKPQGGQAGSATAGAQRPALKGSGGIGNATSGVAKAQPGNLSGQRTISGREVVPPGTEGTSPFARSTLRQTRSQESIKEVIKSHRGSLDFAYRKALRSDPTLKGVITIEFTLSPDGTVISARAISSTVSDPSFEEDVLKRVKTWKFPAYPDSGTTIVTYPIEFSPA